MEYIIFAHDHVITEYNGKYFSSGGLSNHALRRYSSVFQNVNVLTRQVKSEKFPEKLSLSTTDGVTFNAVPNFKNPKKIFQIFKAKKIIKEEVKKADGVIVRLPSSIGSIAYKYAKKYRKPILVEVVGCAWDAYFNHSLIGKIVAPFMYLSMKSKVKDSDFAIYVTESFLQKRYPTKGENTNCSNVSLPLHDSSILDKRLHKITHSSDNKVLNIATVAATNVKYKGQQYVIKAMNNLKNTFGLEINYYIIGGGDSSFLESFVDKYSLRNNVFFTGNLPHDEIFTILQDIDVYIQPSKQEGLPRALIEAMSLGLPCLGAKTAGIPELLSEEYIFSNKHSNYKEISSLLKELSDDKLVKMAKNNFIKSKEYSRETIENRRRNFLNEFKNN